MKSSVRASTVTLPRTAPPDVLTILQFFEGRFPGIAAEVWRGRFEAGKVWAAAGVCSPDMPFHPGLEVHYRREVASEPEVRRDWRLVFRDEHLLVVDKPPFLPVTPGGSWVRNCLLHILGEDLGETDLAPLHRIDRLTSGLIVFSQNTRSRSHFSLLFQRGQRALEKRYTAIVEIGARRPPGRWTISNHIARSENEYWRQTVLANLPANATGHYETVAVDDRRAVCRVQPVTGRKHQIRLQLSDAGFPIVNDPVYGSEPRHDPNDLSRRLGLDACELTIRDFPGFDGGPPINANWTSATSAGDLLMASVPTD